MESGFDERAFFTELEARGIRYLLIGRRAIAALGAPVLTSDYDLWLAFDDVEKLNELGATFDLAPNHTPTEARGRGRYVLEGDEHLDVMIARAKSTHDGISLTFDDAYDRRNKVAAYGTLVNIPTIDDLITTKRWALRPKDVLDINFLDSLRRNA